MAAVQILQDFKITTDANGVCTDGVFAFFRAGTAQATTLIAYSDKELTVPIGVTCTATSLGYPGLSGTRSEVWVSDTYGVDVRITGTGVTTFTNEYYTQAASTTAEETDTRPAFKNLLANGGFALWTSGTTSFSNISGSAAAVETADGWYISQGGSAANEISRQTGIATGSRYAIRIGRASSATSTDQIRLYKTVAVDEAYRARSQTITVSFTAKAGANFSPTGIAVLLVYGTAESEDGNSINSGGWTGQQTIASATQAITTSAVRYQFSGTVAAGAKEIGVQLGYTGVGTAGAADYYDVSDVQIEIASAASEFELPPSNLEVLRVAKGVPGDYSESEVLVGSAVSLTTATDANITSLSLAAGEYLLWGQVSLSLNGATTLSRTAAWISSTSATFPTAPNKGAISGTRTTFETGVPQYIPVGTRRVRVTSTTTYYLSTQASFAVNTCAGYGILCSLRIR